MMISAYPPSGGWPRFIPERRPKTTQAVDEKDAEITRLRAEVERLNGEFRAYDSSEEYERKLRQKAERERAEALAQVKVLLDFLGNAKRYGVLGGGPDQDVLGFKPREVEQILLTASAKARAFLDRLHYLEQEMAEYRGVEERCKVGHNKKFSYRMEPPETEAFDGCVACDRDYAESRLQRTEAAVGEMKQLLREAASLIRFQRGDAAAQRWTDKYNVKKAAWEEGKA